VARRDVALLVLLGAAWGSVYPLTAVALEDLATPTVVVARTALAALLLLPVAVSRRALTVVRGRAPAIVLAGLLQATIPLVLLTLGQQHVASGLAGILSSTQPVWATMLTASLDRGLHRLQAAGVALGLGGVVVLFSGEVGGNSSVLGGALIVSAAFFYAVGSVYIQRVIPDVPPLATATVAMVLSAVVLAPFAATAAPPRFEQGALFWLVVLGVVSTGAALVAFYSLIQRVGAIRANLVAYLAPGFAVLYGALLLNERVRPPAIAGLALILAGSFLAGRSGGETRVAAQRQPPGLSSDHPTQERTGR
jgi:drug/metabolite transporter (DMT)-like permease